MDLPAFTAFPSFEPFAAFADFSGPIIEATDDLDTAGAGLPISREEAALELRVEEALEDRIFVRSVLLLVAIALLLTARTIWVG